MEQPNSSSSRVAVLVVLSLFLVTTPPTAGCAEGEDAVQSGQEQIQKVACDQLKQLSTKQLDQFFQVTVREFEKTGVKFDRRVWADGEKFARLYEQFKKVVNCPEPSPPALERLSEKSPGSSLSHHESPGPDAFCGPSHGPPSILNKLPYVSRCLNRACYRHDSCYARCSEPTGGGDEDCAWTEATKPCDDPFFEEADRCPLENGTIAASLFVITAARALVRLENFDGCNPNTQCPRPDDPGLGFCGQERWGAPCLACLEKVDPGSACRLSACITKEEDDICYTANCPSVSECFGWGKEDYAGTGGSGGAGASGGAGGTPQGGEGGGPQGGSSAGVSGKGGSQGGTAGQGGQAGTGGNPSACESCWGSATAGSGPCAAEASACEGSSDCVAFYNCATQCTSDACVQGCAQTYPVGSGLYSKLATCGCSKACPTACINECGGETGGASGSGGSGGSSGAGTSGSSGTGGTACQDYSDEPGATSSNAYALPSVEDSDGWWKMGGRISSTQDKDWFKFYGSDTLGSEVDPAAYIKEPGLTLCIYSTCAYQQSCSYKPVQDEQTGAEGCCIKTPGTVYAATDCDGVNDSATIYMQVSKPDAPSCIDYTLEYRFGK
jgi:hypothetical protein